MKFGTVEFEIDSTKVVETEKELVIPAKIARECVLPYKEGMAYRPKAELQKSFFTFDGAWTVSGKHPDQMLVSKPSEISGRLMNIQWDEKEALVTGDVHLFKDRNTPQFLEDVKTGKLKDVSIGFIYSQDMTPGEFNGQKYDFIQRDLMMNHVAVGVPKGRCPSPLVGLTVDMADVLPAKTIEEIDSKIKALQTQRDSLVQQANDSFGDASFPDSCFAYVPETAKGPNGNKSERKLPYKNADGSVDIPHVRNALARLNQTQGISDAEKARIRSMLEAILKKDNPNYQPSGDEADIDAASVIERFNDLSSQISSH